MELQRGFRVTTMTLRLKWSRRNSPLLHPSRFSECLGFSVSFLYMGTEQTWGCGYHRGLVMSKSTHSTGEMSESSGCTVDFLLPHSVITKFPIYAWCALKPAMSSFNHLNWNAQETFMELQHSAMHWACYRPLVKSMAGKALRQNKSSIGQCRSQPFHPLMWNRKRRIIWHRSSHMHKWPCMYI